MHHGSRHRISGLAITLILASLGVAACGGGSGDPNRLLHQTFTGSHKVNSGNLGFKLTVVPTGSSTLKGPIFLSLSGPFRSLGTGKLPQSAFSISFGAMGNGASVTIISTGTSGYVTFQGQSYKLPQATFQRLESSFSQLGTSSGSSRGSGVLARLGIQPQHWLVNPKIVGDEAVGGTDTTHIRSGINVAALLADLNTFLARASSLGVSGASNFPRGISSTTRSRIADEIQNPTFDLWTGKTDKTLRRLQVQLSLPVTGQTSTALGGLRSAGIGLTMQYANLNQPQSIAAPTSLQPYSVFQTKLRTFLQAIQTGIGNATAGAAAGGASQSGTAANYQRYTQCIQSAGADVAKMQKCAPLLGGG